MCPRFKVRSYVRTGLIRSSPGQRINVRVDQDKSWKVLAKLDTALSRSEHICVVLEEVPEHWYVSCNA